MHRYATPLLIATLAGLPANADAFGTTDDIFDREIVNPNDNVSFVLKGVSLSSEVDLFTTNDGNPASVSINNSGASQNVGAGRGNFDMLVNWREFFETGPNQGDPSRIRFEITTSSGGPIVPQDDFDNGFNFVRWEIGNHNDAEDIPFADAIDFRRSVSEVILVEATAVFFQNQTVLDTRQYGFTIGAGSDWDGTDADPGNIFTIDRAVNRIQITYDYIPIPAPGSVAVLAGAGLIAARRRR
ncbi:MAG: hypothetical protein AAFR76_12105 [Planctomycetota bacterium]